MLVSKGVKDINMSLYYESFGNAFRAMNSVDSSFYYLQQMLEFDPKNKLKADKFWRNIISKKSLRYSLTNFSKAG